MTTTTLSHRAPSRSRGSYGFRTVAQMEWEKFRTVRSTWYIVAIFAVTMIGLAMLALIVAPTLYLLVPLVLPLDVIPKGLKETVGPKLTNERGRSFLKLAFSELEGAIERAADKIDAREERPAPAAAAPEPPAAGDNPGQ